MCWFVGGFQSALERKNLVQQAFGIPAGSLYGNPLKRRFPRLGNTGGFRCGPRVGGSETPQSIYGSHGNNGFSLLCVQTGSSTLYSCRCVRGMYVMYEVRGEMSGRRNVCKAHGIRGVGLMNAI